MPTEKIEGPRPERVEGLDYRVLARALDELELIQTPIPRAPDADGVDYFSQHVRESLVNSPTIQGALAQSFRLSYVAWYVVDAAISRLGQNPPAHLLEANAALRAHVLELGARMYADTLTGKSTQPFLVGNPIAWHEHFTVAGGMMMDAARAGDAAAMTLHQYVAETCAAESSNQADMDSLDGLLVEAQRTLDERAHEGLWEKARLAANEGDLGVAAIIEEVETFAAARGFPQRPDNEKDAIRNLALSKARQRAIQIATALAEEGDATRMEERLFFIEQSKPTEDERATVQAIREKGRRNAIPGDWARAAEAIEHISSAPTAELGGGFFADFLRAMGQLIEDSELGGVPVDREGIADLEHRGYKAEVERLLLLAASRAEERAKQIRDGTDTVGDSEWKEMDEILRHATLLTGHLSRKIELPPERQARITLAGRTKILEAIRARAVADAGQGDVSKTRRELNRAEWLASQWELQNPISAEEGKGIEVLACRNGWTPLIDRAEDLARRPSLIVEQEDRIQMVEGLIREAGEYIQTAGLDKDAAFARDFRRRIAAIRRTAYTDACLAARIEVWRLEAAARQDVKNLDPMERMIEAALSYAQKGGIAGVVVTGKPLEAELQAARRHGYNNAYLGQLETAERAAITTGSEADVVAALEASRHYAGKAGVEFQYRVEDILKRYHARVMNDTMQRALVLAKNGGHQAVVNALLRDARQAALKAGLTIADTNLNMVRDLARENEAKPLPPRANESQIQFAFRRARRTLDPRDIAEFIEAARNLLPEGRTPDELEAVFGRTVTPSGTRSEHIIEELEPATSGDSERMAAARRDLGRIAEVYRQEFQIAAQERGMRERPARARAAK